MESLRSSIALIVVAVLLTACAMPAGRYDQRHHANLCPLLGQLGSTMAWPRMQQGVPVADVLDLLDARFARSTSPAEQRTAYYARWATEYVYLHPHWTQHEAHIGVEQACLRAAYY